MVIHVNQETEKFNVSLQVFFVYINDDDGDNDSEDDTWNKQEENIDKKHIKYVHKKYKDWNKRQYIT